MDWYVRAALAGGAALLVVTGIAVSYRVTGEAQISPVRIDWTGAAESASQTPGRRVALADFTADPGIALVCHLTPYVNSLPEGFKRQSDSARGAGVFPIGEGDYAFMYFDVEGSYLGVDYLPANKGEFRPKLPTGTDGSCVFADEAYVENRERSRFSEFHILKEQQ